MSANVCVSSQVPSIIFTVTLPYPQFPYQRISWRLRCSCFKCSFSYTFYYFIPQSFGRAVCVWVCESSLVGVWVCAMISLNGWRCIRNLLLYARIVRIGADPLYLQPALALACWLSLYLALSLCFLLFLFFFNKRHFKLIPFQSA